MPNLEESNNAMNEIFPPDQFGLGALDQANRAFQENDQFNNEIAGLLDRFAGNRPNPFSN